MMTGIQIPDERVVAAHFNEGVSSYEKGQLVVAETCFNHTKRLLLCRLQAPIDDSARQESEKALEFVNGFLDACQKGTPMPALPAVSSKMAMHSTGVATATDNAPSAKSGLKSPFTSGASLTREEALMRFKQQLDDLVGLKEFKQELSTFMNTVALKMLLGGTRPSCHLVLTGNPGTGKTTVAKLLGDFLYGIGYLDKGHLVRGDEAVLCGTHVGEAQVNTENAFKQARGGILFIDEAYTLARGGENSYGQKVIDVITHRLDEDRGDLIVVAAGYKEEMEDLLRKNPGLKGKFTKSIHLPDYSASEMVAISKRFLAENRATAEPEFFMRAHVLCSLKTMFPDRLNANARFVREGIVENSFGPMADRVIPTNPSPSEEGWKVMLAADLPFEKLTGISWSAIDLSALQWELTREDGSVIPMEASDVGQYFAKMTDHRVLDDGQPELTPASKEYLAELMRSVP